MTYFYEIDSIPTTIVPSGAALKLVWGEKSMLAVVDLEPEQIVPLHSHPHEQGGYVISGTVEFEVNGEKQILHPGSVYLIPGDVPHIVRVLPDGPVRLFEVFCPPREDFIASSHK